MRIIKTTKYAHVKDGEVADSIAVEHNVLATFFPTLFHRQRTESNRTANANGGTLRGCTCLRSALPLARARSAPTEQEMHQQSKSCTNRARNAPTEQELHQTSKSCTLCECVKTTMNEESAVLCPVRASSSFDITPRVSASEIVSFSMLRRSFTAGILAVAVSASTTATIVLAAFMIEEYFFSSGSSGSSILSSTELTTLITALQ